MSDFINLLSAKTKRLSDQINKRPTWASYRQLEWDKRELEEDETNLTEERDDVEKENQIIAKIISELKLGIVSESNLEQMC